MGEYEVLKRWLFSTRSGQAVKRKKGPGQTVKSGFRAESSSQDRFQAVKNLDPGRGRSYGKYWSDRPLWPGWRWLHIYSMHVTFEL